MGSQPMQMRDATPCPRRTSTTLARFGAVRSGGFWAVWGKTRRFSGSSRPGHAPPSQLGQRPAKPPQSAPTS
eukprot:2138177-Rhodomonas_salina.1